MSGSSQYERSYYEDDSLISLEIPPLLYRRIQDPKGPHPCRDSDGFHHSSPALDRSESTRPSHPTARRLFLDQLAPEGGVLIPNFDLYAQTLFYLL